MTESPSSKGIGYSINFWRGCGSIKPSCARCYQDDRGVGFHDARRSISASGRGTMSLGPHTFSQEGRPARVALRLGAARREALAYEQRALKSGQVYRIFANSMGDFWDEQPDLQRARRTALEVMRQTPHLAWMVLTARPEAIPGLLSAILEEARAEMQSTPSDEGGLFINWLKAWVDGQAPSNIWLGTTMGGSEEAQGRILDLLKVPAAVRFLSCDLCCPKALFGADHRRYRIHSRRSLDHRLVAGMGTQAFLKDVLGYLRPGWGAKALGQLTP
ncbi:MAG: DUF5131 family protein [Holophagaceae bacterium]